MTSSMIRVSWSRAELLTVKEAIDLTPYFDGRTEVRDTVRRAVRPGQLGEVSLERETAERFAGRLVAVDLATSLAKVRLMRALQASAMVADDRGNRGTGEIDDALALAREALTVAAQLDEPEIHAQALVALAEVLERAGRRPEEDDALRKALDLYERKGNRPAAARIRAQLEELAAVAPP